MQRKTFFFFFKETKTFIMTIMSVSFLACSECQLPIFAAFVSLFIFLFSRWTCSSTVSWCNMGTSVTWISRSSQSTSKQMREPWLYMHALCVKASLTKPGGIKLATMCKTPFFFFFLFLRWNLKNDAVLVSHLKKKKE